MLVERFGLDTAVFDELASVRWSNRGLYLVNRELQLPDSVRLDSPGLFFIRTGHRHAKMTTEATLLLGQHATRNVIELTSAQAKTYLQRQIVTPTPAQTVSLTETGFVIMNYRGYPLGQGVFHTKSGQIESHFPKAWSRADVQL